MPASPSRLDQARLAALDSFLLELNQASAEVILPLFRAENGLRNKAGPGDFDPVTEADQGAERAIRQRISERFPEHGVIGEEYGEDRPDAEFVWVLDPIDGTRAFISGLPLWTTLIALRYQGEPVLGSIGQPFIGEIFIGHAGGSRLVARGGETSLKTRPCPRLSDALIATTDPAIFEGAEDDAWRNLRRSVRLARLGCDAYAYAMVAMGTLDLVVESRLKCWDIDCAAPLLEGAGGLVADWTGASLGRNGGQVAIVGDPALLDPAVALLSLASK
ncbi:MAG TPA: histidinol-phosphatase [Caulobacteraceae bacterium]|jgi:histidinol phosphatase-like enzyme (inositol monophosphatase family)|nr:histidinol-phosphatase [Caulobacteraceae bacterium]